MNMKITFVCDEINVATWLHPLVSQWLIRMNLEKAAPVFAFRAIPTTLLALITYLSVFIALVVTDALSNVPKDQGGLNIQQAYEDLRQV